MLVLSLHFFHPGPGFSSGLLLSRAIYDVCHSVVWLDFPVTGRIIPSWVPEELLFLWSFWFSKTLWYILSYWKTLWSRRVAVTHRHHHLPHPPPRLGEWGPGKWRDLCTLTDPTHDLGVFIHPASACLHYARLPCVETEVLPPVSNERIIWLNLRKLKSSDTINVFSSS